MLLGTAPVSLAERVPRWPQQSDPRWSDERRIPRRPAPGCGGAPVPARPGNPDRDDGAVVDGDRGQPELDADPAHQRYGRLRRAHGRSLAGLDRTAPAGRRGAAATSHANDRMGGPAPPTL